MSLLNIHPFFKQRKVFHKENTFLHFIIHVPRLRSDKKIIQNRKIEFGRRVPENRRGTKLYVLKLFGVRLFYFCDS